MPSRVDVSLAARATEGTHPRARVELALRVIAFAALAGALLLVSGFLAAGSSSVLTPSLFRTDTSGKAQSLRTVVQSSLLETGGGATTLRPVHLLATRVPSDTSRALLAAARNAGVPVSWTDSTMGGAVAVEVRALIDPKGGYTLRVAAPNGTPVEFRDSLGLIDSVTAAGGGASVVAGRVTGSVIASVRAANASATAPLTPVVRRILVFAEPGWEGKFTVAALEERGWNVEVRYAIGKNVTVTQGSPVAPDTARYAAVVALDSSVLPHVAWIRRYAQSGGGVVIAGAATTLREFGDMLPGRAGERQPGVPGGLNTETPFVGLGWRPLAPDSNAAVIMRSTRVAKDSRVAAVIARRFGAGRVVESGYDGVWEWRMAGPDGSLEAHRNWWAELVSAAAFAPEQDALPDGAPVAQAGDAPGAAAPYADSRVILGNPVSVPSAARTGDSRNWEMPLVLLAMSCLLAEWASRRLRGSK